MTNREAIIRQIETVPEHLLPEVLDFIESLKRKHQQNESKTTSIATGSTAKNKIVIYTDGACTGNPGAGGYGAVIIDGKQRREISGGYALTTNNRMEMMAAIAALKALKNKCAVTLYSDSKYIVDAINKGWAKRWQANGWKRNKKEPAKNPDLWQELLNLCQKHQVDFVWVKGHAGIAENERCDAIAVKAAQQTNLPPDAGYC